MLKVTIGAYDERRPDWTPLLRSSNACKLRSGQHPIDSSGKILNGGLNPPSLLIHFGASALGQPNPRL
jgi:hypothetical protein